MNIRNIVVATVGLLAGASMSFTATAAKAEECNRGTLDKAYCDRNFDQTADLPLDEADWVDPKTIIFETSV